MPPKKASSSPSLQETLDEINQIFGEGSIMTMGKSPTVDVEVISTGLLSLDLAIGAGGIPRGRIIEVYGPFSGGKTSLCLSCIAEAQKMGLTCAFIDVEYALDKTWATTLGVDVDQLLISQPSNGHDALEIVLRLAKSGEVALIVVDSVAALTPRAELEGDFGDANVGLQARLMSQAMRKLSGVAGDTKTTIMFTNQIREKIGVIYGCLSGNVTVPFTDGTSEKMKAIVDGKIQKNVWAWDEDLERIVEAPITNWFHNGAVNSRHDWIHIRTEAIGTSNGAQGIHVTPNHQILTLEDGWMKASDLKPNYHHVKTHLPTILNHTAASFLYGAVIGDAGLAGVSQPASLIMENTEQPEYHQWKLDMLEPVLGEWRRTEFFNHNKKYLKHASPRRADLGLLRDSLKGNRLPRGVMEHPEFNDLSLALWYMDDGSLNHAGGFSISVKRLRNNIPEWEYILRKLWDLGVEASCSLSSGDIQVGADAADRFFQRISTFVPPEMSYKLPEKWRNKYSPFSLYFEKQEMDLWVEVLSVSTPLNKSAGLNKYDIEVAGYSNYMVGSTRSGFLVHNSNEVRPGGRALPFYASLQFDVRRIETVKDGNESVANRIRIKIPKNKVGAPYKQAEVELTFGEGFSKVGDILDLAIERDLIKRKGAWFVTLGGETIGQGREKAKQFLLDNPEIYAEIENKIRAV